MSFYAKKQNAVDKTNKSRPLLDGLCLAEPLRSLIDSKKAVLASSSTPVHAVRKDFQPSLAAVRSCARRFPL